MHNKILKHIHNKINKTQKKYFEINYMWVSTVKQNFVEKNSKLDQTKKSMEYIWDNRNRKLDCRDFIKKNCT